MVEAGIFEGDFLVIDRSAKTKTGDVVVAQYQNEATVKTIQYPRTRGDLISLIPQNRSMKPIAVKANEDFEVLGKVVALQRYY